MKNVLINGQKLSTHKDQTILELCKENNIFVPSLCFMKGLLATASCKLCVVEIEGFESPVSACETTVSDGMIIKTESELLNNIRRYSLEKIMKRHPNDCLTCEKSAGRCELQELTYIYGVNPKERTLRQKPIDKSSASIVRNMDKCIGCERCVKVCRDIQKIGVFEIFKSEDEAYAVTKNGMDMDKTLCINCGQCVKACPVAALTEKVDTHKVLKAINDPSKHVVFQMAPAIQNIIGEEFGLKPGVDTTNKIAAAMKLAGGKAFTTDFAADVTIMEEGTELIQRLENNGVLPMITSCCPGWVKFIEMNYPALLSHLSSAKSPQQMFGSLVKSYYAEKSGFEPNDIYHVSIMPCTAKKFEIKREEMEGSVDSVLTAREAANLFKLLGIDIANIKPEDFDNLMGTGTGAGRIFANTGGVMEAALRSVISLLTGKAPEFFEFESVRGFEAIKTAKLAIGNNTIKVCVVNGIGNVKPVLDEIAAGKSTYHFIEVMACPGGCINGGGAPIRPADLSTRMAGVYNSDMKSSVRLSHENPELKMLYKDFLGEPCGEKAHHLLHTHYCDRSKD